MSLRRRPDLLRAGEVNTHKFRPTERSEGGGLRTSECVPETPEKRSPCLVRFVYMIGFVMRAGSGVYVSGAGTMRSCIGSLTVGALNGL